MNNPRPPLVGCSIALVIYILVNILAAALVFGIFDLVVMSVPGGGR